MVCFGAEILLIPLNMQWDARLSALNSMDYKLLKPDWSVGHLQALEAEVAKIARLGEETPIKFQCHPSHIHRPVFMPPQNLDLKL